MMTNKQLLSVAVKQLGNTGGKYRKYVGEGGNWCDMFVYWLFNANGCGALLNWTTKAQKINCPTSIRWCKKNLAQIPLYLAQPCDLIYFDWDRNGNPNHIGIVEERDSTKAIHTIEGNTSGGKVARKHREGKYVQGVFRPHFKGEFKLKTLAVDGDCGYNTIANLQKALGGCAVDGVLGKATVNRLQQYLAIKQDGNWGTQTSKAVQSKMCGFKGKAVDGAFGKQSVMALQRWINSKLYSATKPATTKPATTKPATTPTAKPTATLRSYKISIDLTNQICTVYGIYSDGKVTPIMSEWVSTARKGKVTPVGNWKIQGAKNLKAKYRTAKLSGGKSYAEFLVRFKGAKCMHTVPYSKRNTKGYVNKNEFNKLGTPASAGCVRMPYKLAKFIYNNCPVGTPVIVFKGKSGFYPMGKPKKYTATSNIDPTK